jgi:hypothetical protein
MTRLKQSEEEPFQGSRDQQMGQFSMQETAGFGSDFGANQQRGDVLKCPVTAN